MKRLLLAFLAALLLGASASRATGMEDMNAPHRRGDYAEAAREYRAAAEQGNASAQSHLGNLYRMGQGVKQSDVEAVKWFRLAAAQGNAAGQGGLGLMYGAGDGVSQDYVRAYMWSHLAAGSGYKMAVANVDIFAKRMTPRQVEDAKKMARECQQRNFKSCD